MNDLQNPTQALREFSRVLRSRGRVVILMLHPCFYNKHAERSQPERKKTDKNFRDSRRGERLLQGMIVHGSASVTFEKRKA